MPRHSTRQPVAVAVFAALLAAGCGANTGTVSGEVTYDGAPVKSGQITFTPADGNGPTAGGPIADGRYSVDAVAPGPKLVSVISSSEDAPSIRSSGDLAKMTPEQKARYDPKTGIISADLIPQDAEGNNQKFDVKSGAQQFNVTLKKPAGKK